MVNKHFFFHFRPNVYHMYGSAFKTFNKGHAFAISRVGYLLLH